MPRFQTVVRRARFAYSPFTAQEMQGFAQLLADTIRARIQSGQNIYDQAAAPLKPAKTGRRGYPDYKAARGLQPIRDWTWTGHTMRCLKVLTANENRAVIGFLDEAMPGRSQTASQIAFWNNQRERQWGVSPADRQKVIPLIYNYRPVVTLQEIQTAGGMVMAWGGTAAQGRASARYFSGMRQVGFAQYIGDARAA
jgi:hypothetical protein